MDEQRRSYVDPFSKEIMESAKNLEALGAVNLAAIFCALIADTDKFTEKENIKTLIYMRTPLSVFEMPISEYGAFRRDAENFRIISSAITDQRSPEKISVIIRTSDIPRIKQIFDEASYDTSNIVLEDSAKNQNARTPQEHISGEGGHTSRQTEVMRTMISSASVRSLIREYRQEIESNNPHHIDPEQEHQSWRDMISDNFVGGDNLGVF